MSAKIIPKKSTVAAKVPSVVDLDKGEVGINFTDAVIYGRHPIDDTIVNLSGAPELHTHTISQVTGLQTALDNKQPLDADLTSISGLSGTSGLLKKTAANSWSLDTSTYITGNQTITFSGDLTGSGTTSIAVTLANSGVSAGTYGSSIAVPVFAVDSKGRITSVSNTTIRAGTTAQTGVLQLTNATNSTSTTTAATPASVKSAYDLAAAAIPSSQKGSANGVATLDAAGLIPTTQLPSYVDDVLEFTNLAGFPTTGESGKIYVAIDTGKIYRWSGSVYLEISPTAGNADSATKLATARTIALSGGVSGSSSFDGSANITISTTVANDSHSHTFANITSKPTTLSGYGITDATPSSHVGSTGTSHGVATTSVSGFMSSSDKSKLDGIAAGAQVNQNAFSNFAVSGQTTVAADTATDTLTLAAGTGVSIATNATTDTITITNSAPDQTVTLTGSGATTVTGTYPNFTISSTDTNTTYGIATATVPGIIELGSDTVQSVAANAVSATAARSYAIQKNAENQLVVNVPWSDTNTTYTANNGVQLSGTTFSHADTSSVGNLSSDNANGVVIQDVSFTFDGFGHVTAATAATVDLDGRYYTETEADSRFVNVTGDTMSGNLSFGSSTRQMLNLYADSYAFGVQSSTLFARSNGRFSWFKGGAYSASENDPGAGGVVSMTLDQNSNLTVTGSLFATSKSFRIDHPTKPGKKLQYGSLEGPEHGVYHRGEVIEGNIIELPEYWSTLVDRNTITVQLTPKGKFQKLFVESVNDDDTITVGVSSLFKKKASFYYVVNAERKDIDRLVVEE